MHYTVGKVGEWWAVSDNRGVVCFCPRGEDQARAIARLLNGEARRPTAGEVNALGAGGS